jgi:hypothetical protein
MKKNLETDWKLLESQEELLSSVNYGSVQYFGYSKRKGTFLEAKSNVLQKTFRKIYYNYFFL